MHAGEIDESSVVPLYHQVADSLRRRIADGEWAATGFLPSVVDLGHDYSIGQATIRRAMGVLLTAGLIEQSKGQRARILPTPGARERVQLPPGALLWVERATEEERRRESLPRGAWMVVVHHKALQHRYPADRYEFQAPWRDPHGDQGLRSDHGQ